MPKHLLHSTIICNSLPGYKLVLVTDTSVGSTPQAKHHALTVIEEALSRHIEATCITCQKKHKFNIELNPAGKSAPLQWSTQVDPSPVLDSLKSSPTRCLFQGLKLTTPTFQTNAIYSTSSDDDGHVHQLDYTGMIKAVLQHAHRNLGTLPSENPAPNWLYAPVDRQMEVHIGNDGLGFLDSTHEKVEQLTNLCSRQIDVLHMGRSHAKASTTSKFSSTIHFNQAPSALHPAEVLAWIDVCLSTVRRCADPEHDLDLSPKGQFASATFSASEMLRALATSAMTQRFYGCMVADHQTRCQQAIANAMLAMSSGSKIAELALGMANRRLQTTRSNAMLANIKVKLLEGAYGAFSDPYLRMALLSMNTDM
ncbi:hypothetical protein AC579_9122 [Pseudocercospora musae]|uniref:Uncharacterized protein n=1 Tax=Pseudocercospora musae TaxID=113226 RepID=A0A139IIQ7_9PEZI|nr:hypothetical protein AC579_9122 [Pseudocercospora musae]